MERGSAGEFGGRAMNTTPLPICWEPERLSDAVTFMAKVGAEKADYFLATHAPMRHIIAEKGFVPVGGPPISDEDLFGQLVTAWEKRLPSRDLSVLISGEAGTGKSHLINWLKLRFDVDLEHRRLRDVTTVLVRRKSGSLRDALTQLIEQLDEAFGKYLQPVRDAIDRLSDATARLKLCQAIALELSPPRRLDRGKTPLFEVNKRLRHLHEACMSRGFRTWLTADGGVIARTIEILTARSEAEDRESRPRFKADEFLAVPDDPTRRDNIEDVQALIDELKSKSKVREDAAALLNEALDDAVGEVTGLSGGNLSRIFEQIRQDLKARKERLALFIEDVTAMSVLDLEVVKAVEPREDVALCPLLAVMGVTDTGMDRLRGLEQLRDNDRQRLTHIASVGREAVGQWKADAEGLATFTARYLNAVRLSEAEVRQVARHRRETRGDVSISRCTTCPHRLRCHEAFGKVELNGMKIGLYPFSENAPGRLLTQLQENPHTGVAQTPRGLLQFIVQPLLADVESLQGGTFPSDVQLPYVARPDPRFWSEFTNQYCGDWSPEDIERARLLALFWLPPGIDSAADAAASMEPFRVVLKLPAFSKKVKARKPEDRGTPPPQPQPKPKPAGSAAAIDKVLANLREWIGNEDLRDDAAVRGWLAEFVRESVPWDDYREPPRAVWYDLLRRGADGDARDKYKHVRVEGQKSKPIGTKFHINFPRTEETRALIEALARFDLEGSKSWMFPGGEIQKRTVARWLRAHTTEMIQALQPPPELVPGHAVTCAVELLSLAAFIRARKKLPENPGEFAASILKGWGEAEGRLVRLAGKKWRDLASEDPSARNDASRVVTLSAKWQKLVENLQLQSSQLIKFLLDELEVPQGRGGDAVNFIDPRPLLARAGGTRDAFSVLPLDPEFFKNFWETRFTPLRQAKGYEKLTEALADERAEVKRYVDAVSAVLTDWGYDVSHPREAATEFLEHTIDLHKTRQEGKLVVVNDPEFDQLYRSQHLTRRAGQWAAAFEQATQVTADADPFRVVLFDPRPLLEFDAALAVSDRYLKEVSKEVAESEAEFAEKGDPHKLRDELLATLDRLTAGEPEGSSDDQTPGAEGEA
jgi:hypothetical protein